jgi:hypothetical protein
MIRVRQLIVIITIFGFLAGHLVVPAPPVYACSCLPPGAPLDEMASATAVFAGRVMNIEVAGGEAISPDDAVTVTFGVSRLWKGPEESVVTVTTPRDSASCGIDFQNGQEYLVYATGSQAELSTNLCSRTASLADAGADLEALGDGRSPIPAAQMTPAGPVAPAVSQSPSATWWWGVSLILLAALLSGVLYLVWHRGGRSHRT